MYLYCVISYNCAKISGKTMLKNRMMFLTTNGEHSIILVKHSEFLFGNLS